MNANRWETKKIIYRNLRVTPRRTEPDTWNNGGQNDTVIERNEKIKDNPKNSYLLALPRGGVPMDSLLGARPFGVSAGNA